MNTDLRLVISREELADIVANTVTNRLKSILPMSQSASETLSLDLMNSIAPQILIEVNLHIVDGVVHS